MPQDYMHLTPCGLVFDAAGVVLLGLAFFFKTRESMIQEAGTYWNSNPYVLRAVVTSKFDGMAGSMLLLIGFIYQALGYSGYCNSALVLGSYAFLPLFLLVYFSWLRGFLISRWVTGMEKIINEKK